MSEYTSGMLRTDVIELINKGNTWAFLGAGASMDAGAPSWPQLLDRVLDASAPSAKAEISSDHNYLAARKDKKLPSCFSRIEHFIGRERLEQIITSEFSKYHSPGELLRELANWPFAGYVTTNYDGLIERALQVGGHAGGWTIAGNSDSEIRKLSGNIDHVIWHVHGAVNIEPSASRLVITEKDYDDLYLEKSRAATQLQALLTHKRIVFFGFSFEDAELQRLIKIVARYSNPARPTFAFLAGLGGAEGERARVDLLEKYNVDVIPYDLLSGSHTLLKNLLRVYSSFLLKRDQKFDQPQRQCPSYHQETTSLLVYNKLAAAKNFDIENDTLGSLLKARVVSLLKFKGPQSFEALANDLAERMRILRGTPPDDIDNVVSFIQRYVNELTDHGFVEGSDPVRLTEKGADLTEDQAAAAKVLHEQFASSLQGRARTICGGNEGAAKKVALAAEGFLGSCVEHRALGVSMTLHSPRTDFRKFHIVALLQHLPEFMSQLDSEEALALVEVITGFLAKPTAEEAKYFGVALQARFSLTLLGYDPNLVKARVKLLSSTLFVIDASMLIHLLARSSVGNASARAILNRLTFVNAPLATTDRLVTEVAEHARWARDHVKTRSGLTPQVLIAATGHAGLHENLFVDGFLHEVMERGKSFDFDSYLDSICGDPSGHTATDEVFKRAIEKLGIPAPQLNEWGGFSSEMYSERDQISDEIAEERRGQQTFKHDRQVKAEAEALIIVEKLRNRIFSLKGRQIDDSYFISNTRAIDQVKTTALPVTMRPSAILQWLSTLTPTDTQELAGLVSALLWEMSERGFTVVDKKHIQVTFSPLISASEDELKQELSTNRALMANRYGVSAEKAFSELSGIEVPVVLQSIYAQRAAELEKTLASERAAKNAALKKVSLSDEERTDYLKLKARQREKHLRAKAKQRPGKKKNKKRKKKTKRPR